MQARDGDPLLCTPMDVMRSERVEHLARSAQLLAMTHGDTTPANACETWRTLYAGVRQFTDDMAKHTHLENDVLFPQFEGRRG